jgi:hypothetical protein
MTTIESVQCVLVCACFCCLVSLSWCHNRLATQCTDAAVLMLCSFNCLQLCWAVTRQVHSLGNLGLAHVASRWVTAVTSQVLLLPLSIALLGGTEPELDVLACRLLPDGHPPERALYTPQQNCWSSQGTFDHVLGHRHSLIVQSAAYRCGNFWRASRACTLAASCSSRSCGTSSGSKSCHFDQVSWDECIPCCIEFGCRLVPSCTHGQQC